MAESTPRRNRMKPRTSGKVIPVSGVRSRPSLASARMDAASSTNRRFASTQMAIDKVRRPLDRFTQSQIPFDIHDREERFKVRELCRIYYATHNLIPLCHTPGTMIDVEGSQVAIEQVPEGSLVRTHLGRYREVTDLKSFDYSGEIVTFYYEDRSLTATPEHLLYVFRNNEYLWVRALEVTTDDLLVYPANESCLIHIDIKNISTTGYSGPVYNFEVEEDESYVANGVASHNCIDVYTRFPLQGIQITCFAGETPVITGQGVKDIKSLSGGIHQVLTTGGNWVDAKFEDYGEQTLRKITLERNRRQRVFYATPEHRWFAWRTEGTGRGVGRLERKSGLSWEKIDQIRSMYRNEGVRQQDLAVQFDVSQPTIGKIVRMESWTEEQRNSGAKRTKVELTTDQLVEGSKLVSIYAKRSVTNETIPSPFGVAHGFVWGDGTFGNSRSGNYVDLHGEKDANLLPYFAGHATHQYFEPKKNVQPIRVTGLPNFMKSLVDLDESIPYLYGWLSGYFAADGTVSKSGEVYLDSASRSSIDHVRAICQNLGIKTTDPYEINARKVLPQGSVIEDWKGFRLSIDPSCLSEKFFVVPEHKNRWQNSDKSAERREEWTVVSVEETDRFEKVYCASVPGTEAFALDGNILTGNCKDPELQKFYEQLFFDQLNYKQFLIDAGREFFTVGEVNMLATFNELLGIWEKEEIINPDDLTVTRSPFSDEERYHMAVPEALKEIIETREPRSDYEILVREYPEIIEAARKSQQGLEEKSLGEGLEISNVLLSRLVNKVSFWDVYGTPHMLRAFALLNLEEGLYAAQKAVADRLYSPLILAKLGSPDLGDGEPWVPDEDALDTFNDMMSQAMAADFRFITYHYGIEIESVFGRESVPRFDQDFDRIESKMLEVWGIGESLIQGGSGGAYASSALNSEFVTQMMTSYQENIQEHFKRRVEVVAEAQGHFDYDISDGKRTPIMEEYIEIDDDGESHVRKRPKLLLPELKFATMNIRDESTEREFLMSLKQAGLPISDKIMMDAVDLNFEEQIDVIQEEKIRKVVGQQEMLVKLGKVLAERNLPSPPEMAAMPTAPTSLPLTNDITSPVNVPALTMDPAAMQLAQQNAQTQQGQAPAGPGAAPSAPSSPSGPQGSPPAPTLPQNWISQRPEISDNMRGSMPKAAGRNKSSRRHDPDVINKRNHITEAEAQRKLEEDEDKNK